MKNAHKNNGFIFRILGVTILSLLLSNSSQAQVPSPVKKYPQKVLILGGVAHLGDGQVIKNPAIAFEGEKFTLVKSMMRSHIAVDQYDTVIHLSNEHIYPGFILTDNTLGITEIDALRQTRDFDDVGDFNPNLRAAVAFNVESKIIYTVRNNGILTTQVTPRGGVVSGASGIVSLDGWNYEDAAIRLVDGFHLNWPNQFSGRGPWFDPKPIEKNTGNEQKILDIQLFFANAKSYWKSNPSEKNLKFESLKPLFEGKATLYVHCDMAKELLQVIRFKRELEIPKLVIVGGYDAALLTTELKENNISIILRRVHSLPMRPEDDPYYSYKLPAILHEAGVQFCLGSSGDMEAMNGRNLPFLAGEAAGFGLSTEDALSSITLNAAKILGVDDELGSLESGKRATFFISTGDALDMRTNNVILGWINGKPIDLDDTQKQLYRKYTERYK